MLNYDLNALAKEQKDRRNQETYRTNDEEAKTDRTHRTVVHVGSTFSSTEGNPCI